MPPIQRHTKRASGASGPGLGDYLMLPIAPRQGGSILASLAAGSLLGAGAGVAADIAADRFGLNEPVSSPRERRKRRLRRGLIGAATGLGISSLSNLGVHLADQDKAGGHLEFLKRAPAEDGIASLSSGGTLHKKIVPVGGDIGTRQRKNSSWRASDSELKRGIMADPAIPFHQKRIMFRQIDDVTRGKGRSATMDSLIHRGGGAIAGYYSAVAMGAGPVQRGISAIVGSMVGGAINHHKNSRDWSYTPGFRAYY